MGWLAKLVGYDTFDPSEWKPNGYTYESVAAGDALRAHNAACGCGGSAINETTDGWYCASCGNRV